MIRDSFLQTRRSDVPTIMDYGTHTAKLFNTPPVFAVYMVEKVLRWLKNLGGLDAIQKQNAAKAKKLYDMLDSTEFYRGTAEKSSRSLMNVCFRLNDESLEHVFLSEAAENGLVSMKGHRSGGGVRASIYNAMPPEGVDRLVTFMRAFEHKHS
jgi:phosphoserine aminotransferase